MKERSEIGREKKREERNGRADATWGGCFLSLRGSGDP